MKRAEIKKGMELVYCRTQGGPLNPTASWRNKADYARAIVLDPNHRGVPAYQHSAEAKKAYQEAGWQQVRGSTGDGVLIETERPYRGFDSDLRGTTVTVKEVVLPRQLYDMKVEDVDAFYAERERQDKEAKTTRYAQNKAEVERQQALVDRIEALGVKVEGYPTSLPVLYPDGSFQSFAPSLAVIEALIERAES